MASSLESIRKKVRKITKSPSPSQISNNDIDEIVNTVIKFDMPQEIKLFTLKKTLTFYTRPYVDTYSTVNAPVGSPLFNFKNKYYGVTKPVYISGEEIFLTMSRDQFFGIHPKNNYVVKVGEGSGVNTQFQASANSGRKPVLRNNVLFSATNVNNNSMQLVDFPISDRQGNLVSPNNTLPPTVLQPNNFIDYTTGEFSITFPNPVKNQESVWYHSVPYEVGKPRTILLFNNEFVIRPVPDKSYPVNIEVYIQPSELLNINDKPELDLWWQYIAYKASRKVFEERMDIESATKIEPFIQEQESLVIRRTLQMQSNERSSTIYEDSLAVGGYSPFSFNTFSN